MPADPMPADPAVSAAVPDPEAAFAALEAKASAVVDPAQEEAGMMEELQARAEILEKELHMDGRQVGYSTQAVTKRPRGAAWTMPAGLTRWCADGAVQGRAGAGRGDAAAAGPQGP
jgi:hypothetical protein